MSPRDKYTDPKLRDEIKEKIHNADKGGKPGQWSARKAQMMAAEYRRRGGGYNTTKEQGQSESQKHLDNWTKEEWQTKEGEGTAKQDDGSRKRYLPKKAWEELSENEKEETDKKKLKESKLGKQFVRNTGEAKDARRRASIGSEDGHEKEEEKGRKKPKQKPEGKTGTKRKAKQETTLNKKEKDNTRMQSLRKRK